MMPIHRLVLQMVAWENERKAYKLWNHKWHRRCRSRGDQSSSFATSFLLRSNSTDSFVSFSASSFVCCSAGMAISSSASFDSLLSKIGTESMVALTCCLTDCDDKSTGVDDSNCDSWSDSDSVIDDDDVGDDDDDEGDLCALNVTVCDSLNAVCLWLCSCSCSLCVLVMGADGSGLVSEIRAPDTILSISWDHFAFIE